MSAKKHRRITTSEKSLLTIPEKHSIPAADTLCDAALMTQPAEVAVASRVSTAASISMRMHSGPLPDPETLREYDRIVPGAADRVIAMAERQQKHRHDMEKQALTSSFRSEWGGRIAALLVCAMAFSLSAFLGHCGSPGAASAVAGVTLVAIVSAFLAARGRSPGGAEDGAAESPAKSEVPKTSESA